MISDMTGFISQWISQHYIFSCIALLVLQLALLIAAFRTKKDALWLCSTVTPIISGVLTFYVPSPNLNVPAIEVYLVFCALDVIILFISVGARVATGTPKKRTALWTALWIGMFLFIIALIFFLSSI